jgi:acyl-[acyl-carrier-protein]-phospholipid O-acyltransferase/long-chain-fatty-acid--[acyl-carrier-protein] ligase
MAKKNTSKVAVKDKSTGQSVTYSKALIASKILSSKFQKYDKGFIGIMIPTSAGCVLATTGALLSGRIPVMINYSTGAKTMQICSAESGFRTIITSKALLEKINCPVIDGMILIEDIMKSVSTVDKLKAATRAALPVNLLLRTVHEGEENDTAVILFTSGSEKDPKAVQLTHQNIVANIQGFGNYIGLHSEDILLANLVFFHVFGLTVDLWVPLYYGMTMITYANPLDFQTISKIARENAYYNGWDPSFFWGYLQKAETVISNHFVLGSRS